MQKTQDMRQALPPVGWRAFCRQGRKAQDAETRENDAEVKAN